MVKLAYLRAAFFTAAMNLLLAAHASPVDASPAATSPANSTLPADTKAEQAGTILPFLIDSQGIVNGFLGETLNEIILLRLGVCQRLTSTAAAVTWKKYPDTEGE